MSRSRRKRPFTGITKAESEKDYKAKENRAKRRATRVAVERGDDPPGEKAFGNPWGGPKDGKRRNPKMTPKEMRK